MNRQNSDKLERLFDSDETATLDNLLAQGLWSHLSDKVKSTAQGALTKCEEMPGELVVNASGLAVSINLSLSDLWQVYLPLALVISFGVLHQPREARIHDLI